MKGNAGTGDFKLKGRLDFDVGKHKQGGNYCVVNHSGQGCGFSYQEQGSSSQQATAHVSAQPGAAAGQILGSTSCVANVDSINPGISVNLKATCVNGGEGSNKMKAPYHNQIPLPNGKPSFVSFFKDNRAANVDSMLEFVAPPLGDMTLEVDEIDTVEQTFGHCLVGYVMGVRPRPQVMVNFVKRWGDNVKFVFKDNGWIKFQFSSALDRDAVLHGGPYMILGRQLYLKKLPSCFLYSKEDMEFFPSWVQIHGLPADCWTTRALSRISSVMGKPIHTDKLTITKKGVNYARVLVELDAKKPCILDYSVTLPTGKKVSLKFVYEHLPKFCDKCKSVGHSSDLCGIEGENAGVHRPVKGRGAYRSRSRPRGREDIVDVDVLVDRPNQVDSIATAPVVVEGIDILTPTTEQCLGDLHVEPVDVVVREVDILGKGEMDIANSSTEVEPVAYDIAEDGDENEVEDIEEVDSLSDDYAIAGDGLEDMLCVVIPQDKDEWKTAGKRNKKTMNQLFLRKGGRDSRHYDSGASSMETECIPIDPRSRLPIPGGASKFLKKKLVEMRFPRR